MWSRARSRLAAALSLFRCLRSESLSPTGIAAADATEADGVGAVVVDDAAAGVPGAEGCGDLPPERGREVEGGTAKWIGVSHEPHVPALSPSPYWVASTTMPEGWARDEAAFSAAADAWSDLVGFAREVGRTPSPIPPAGAIPVSGSRSSFGVLGRLPRADTCGGGVGRGGKKTRGG